MLIDGKTYLAGRFSNFTFAKSHLSAFFVIGKRLKACADNYVQRKKQNNEN